jgi:hypothetical protein
MNLVNVFLDKQFKLTLLENNKTDNIIFCKPFEDTLHNLCSYTTRNEDFICRYVLENGERFIITDILLENGTLHKKVKFKLVTTNEKQIPYSVINLKSLTSGERVQMPVAPKPVMVQEHAVKPVAPAPVRSVVKKDAAAYDAQQDISKVKLLEQELLQERTRLENEKRSLSKQKLLVDNQNTIQSTIESLKEELVQEFHDISHRQESLFQDEVSNHVTKINEQLSSHIEEHELQIVELFKKTKTEQNNTIDRQFGQLNENLNNKLKNNKKELEALIQNKSSDYIVKVVEKADELKSLFDEKLAIDLQQYKEKLIVELVDVSKKSTQEFLEEGKAQTQQEIKSHIKTEQDSLQKDFDQNVQDLKAILEKATQQIDSRVPFVEEKMHSLLFMYSMYASN